LTKQQNPIRVMLVDDSPVALTVLSRMLSTSPDVRVVGTANNGREGLELIPRVQPDVICTDLHMPEMDGKEFIRTVMERLPRPILVISVSVLEAEKSANVFELLQAGAVDVFPKPNFSPGTVDSQATKDLIEKIKVIAGVVVFRRPKHARSVHPEAHSKSHTPRIQMVGIGASTGGPQALSVILSRLPQDFSVPVACIQHISQGFLPGLITWLAMVTKREIQLVHAETSPQPGVVYFPAEGTHLVVTRNGMVAPSQLPPYDGHRPSVTILFKSLAQQFQGGAMGVLLTGMGKDGAEGLLSIRRAGGVTVAQDEETSIVFGMPKQAIELNAAQSVLPLDQIAEEICKYT
jgi:two-component system chemotaxis response regulator CheB